VYYLVETVRVSIKLERVDAAQLALRQDKEAKKRTKAEEKLEKKAAKKQHKLEETGPEIQNWTD